MALAELHTQGVGGKVGGVGRGRSPLKVAPDFLDRLQLLREQLAFPLRVSSGYRSPAYNEKVSASGRTGPHTTGRAVDLLIYGERAYHAIALAPSLGFTGIGVSQKSPMGRRFLHLDDLDTSGGLHPRPRLWSY